MPYSLKIGIIFNDNIQTIFACSPCLPFVQRLVEISDQLTGFILPAVYPIASRINCFPLSRAA